MAGKRRGVDFTNNMIAEMVLLRVSLSKPDPTESQSGRRCQAFLIQL